MCFAQIACSVTTRGEKAEEILSKGLQVKEYELKVYTLFCESREQRAESRERRGQQSITQPVLPPFFLQPYLQAHSVPILSLYPWVGSIFSLATANRAVFIQLPSSALPSEAAGLAPAPHY